ncbi:hypothetical protein J45TS6_45640 [Paenibacillus sp. J45TS6]|nr:hypothetical protein J45TS6_45640 [Paenibacillus sp. J45TS6]
MINNLMFTENAYFYRKTKKLTKTKIESVFSKISRNKDGNYLLNFR